jgi:hypothetical protein
MPKMPPGPRPPMLCTWMLNNTMSTEREAKAAAGLLAAAGNNVYRTRTGLILLDRTRSRSQMELVKVNHWLRTKTPPVATRRLRSRPV